MNDFELSQLLAKYAPQSKPLSPIKKQEKEDEQVDDYLTCISQYFEESQITISQSVSKPKSLTYSHSKYKSTSRKSPRSALAKEKSKGKTNKRQFYSPFDRSLYQKISEDNLLEDLKTALQNKNYNDSLASMGMKNAKTLGQGKTRQQIERITCYLDTGELPEQYIEKFNSLIDD